MMRRDTESGLDNFGARYFTSQFGRFMTPDWSASPVLVPYADLGNPQTFNLYSYVSNNPLNGVDPEGHLRLDCGSHPAHYLDNDDGSLYAQEQDLAEFETWSEAAQAPSPQNTQTQQAQNPATPEGLRDQIPRQVRLALATLVLDSNSPTADDKQGGFHEEYAVAGRNEFGDWTISKDNPGAYANPDKDSVAHPSYKPRDQALANSIVEPRAIAHVHPSGTTATGKGWVQPPSAADRSSALSGQINIVFGARNNKVYFYDAAGDIGKPMKLKDFLQ